MNQLDKDLLEALRRRQPPAGFAERVLTRTAESGSRRPLIPRWTLAAAAALVLIAGVWGYREHERRIAGERAKEQMMLALRVTGSELRNIQERLAARPKRTINIPER